jgi:hypothetical protein
MDMNTPATIAIVPIAIIIEPLIVHSGLSYINEDEGPTMDLLCRLKIIPDTVMIIPKMIRNVPMPFICYYKLSSYIYELN